MLDSGSARRDDSNDMCLEAGRHLFLSLFLTNMNMKRNDMGCNCIYLTFSLNFYLLVSYLLLKMSVFVRNLKNIDRKTFSFLSS